MPGSRNWFSFSLRSLLIGMTLLSIILGVWARYPSSNKSPWSGKNVRIVQQYSGTIQLDGTREKIATKYVFDEVTWKKLWQALGETAALPSVDFSKEIVLVGISPNANHVENWAKLHDGGNLQVVPFRTLMGDNRPTFGRYSIDVISSDGVWMIEGWPFWRHRWPYFLAGLVCVAAALGGVVALMKLAYEWVRTMLSSPSTANQFKQ